MASWVSIPLVRRKPSPHLRPNPISISWLFRDAIHWGTCSRDKLASRSPLETNRALRRRWQILCDCLPEVSPNPASFHYFPVKISLAAFLIVWGRYQEPAQALHMLSRMVWLLSCLFRASQLPRRPIASSCTAYLSHRSCQLRPPIPVASVHHTSSAPAESSPCGAEPYWRLCPSPSQVDHLRAAWQALYLTHHHPRLPHPPHRWNMQDGWYCLR